MAATAHPLASAIAVDVLKAGGNAVDGALAANAALGLMEPVGCGIGGDLFALVWDGELHALNASGRAPAARTLEAVLAQTGGAPIPPVGPLSVTVPGAVDGWFELAERFGRKPMAELLAPAIAYGRSGAPIPEVIARDWARNLAAFEAHHAAGRMAIEPVRALYGPAPQAGSLFRNPELASSYEALARGGRAAFYEGPIAEAIERSMPGGDLKAADVAAHRSEWVTPHVATYRGCEVYEIGPNTQGLAALQMLRMLEPYDLAAMDRADAIHVSVEAKRLAFEDRARFYTDPAFGGDASALLDEAAIARRRSLIDPARARPTAPDPAALESGDTTYLCVADEDGMMVSLIQSNYRGMGSGVVVEGCGFMLQNRGELFAIDPGHPNVVAPGKRPFHTIIPAFVTRDGVPWIAFGVMGGAMQPQGHVQILQNRIDFGMDLQAAGEAPRWRHDGSSEPTGQPAEGIGTLHLEAGIATETEARLRALGHATVRSELGFGGYQAIERQPDGTYLGASEPRKDGRALAH